MMQSPISVPLHFLPSPAALHLICHFHMTHSSPFSRLGPNFGQAGEGLSVARTVDPGYKPELPAFPGSDDHLVPSKRFSNRLAVYEQSIADLNDLETLECEAARDEILGELEDLQLRLEEPLSEMAKEKMMWSDGVEQAPSEPVQRHLDRFDKLIEVMKNIGSRVLKINRTDFPRGREASSKRLGRCIVAIEDLRIRFIKLERRINVKQRSGDVPEREHEQKMILKEEILKEKRMEKNRVKNRVKNRKRRTWTSEDEQRAGERVFRFQSDEGAVGTLEKKRAEKKRVTDALASQKERRRVRVVRLQSDEDTVGTGKARVELKEQRTRKMRPAAKHLEMGIIKPEPGQKRVVEKTIVRKQRVRDDSASQQERREIMEKKRVREDLARREARRKEYRERIGRPMYQLQLDKGTEGDGPEPEAGMITSRILKVFHDGEDQPGFGSTLAQPALSHVDERGTAHMVDVGMKDLTLRKAYAVCSVQFGQAGTIRLVEQNRIGKGDVLAVARTAGIMGAKMTPNLIPLCHPIIATQVKVDLELIPPARMLEGLKRLAETDFEVFPTAGDHGGVWIQAKVMSFGQTGVEMEALTAAQTAALTVYDMCKGVDKKLRIGPGIVTFKSGGKSGITVPFAWEALHEWRVRMKKRFNEACAKYKVRLGLKPQSKKPWRMNSGSATSKFRTTSSRLRGRTQSRD